MNAVAGTSSGERILVVSHGHPEISKGGAEIAAYQLYRGLRARGDGTVWFMGCDRRPTRAEMPISQRFGDSEYLYSVGDFDWFKFANRDPRFPEAFRELLLELRPDVVHFHHYINVGVEAFMHVRNALPDARIVVTLHEYLAICNHYGQMVTRPSRNLCYQSKTTECIDCFPEHAESDFYLRERYIRHFLDIVDNFVSPSAFLADRYIRWGIPAEKISVIENVVRPASTDLGEAPTTQGSRLRAGFFGQLSSLKGANVLIEAARLLEKSHRRGISIDIFGDYRNQPPEMQKELIESLERYASSVQYHGPYDESRVDALMRSVDVVIVPSVWWENSPLVIQEALRNRRPIICSNIGGMAEKVRDGKDGFHFHVGSASDLAALLVRLDRDREQLTALQETMQAPPSVESVIDAHLRIYESDGFRRAAAD